MAYRKEILHLAVDIGEAMLQNGGEIYRVEDTMKHILNAYGVSNYNVYVLSNGIFASANDDEDDSCSIIRHVPSNSVQLSRITALNQLSREICTHECALIEAWDRLEKCKNAPDYRMITQVIACGLGCACFGYLFGAQPLDMFITFFTGCILWILITEAGKRGFSPLMINISGSFFATAVSLFMQHIGLPVLQDMIVIGSIMSLVPGTKFTTSIRDFLHADYLSGLIHLMEALLTALEIAVGVGAMFALYNYITGGM